MPLTARRRRKQAKAKPARMRTVTIEATSVDKHGNIDVCYRDIDTQKLEVHTFAPIRTDKSGRLQRALLWLLNQDS